jgi:uncharacterized protein YajQ (UPF0234 family)
VDYLSAMLSFDIVSQANMMEIENAANMAKKEQVRVTGKNRDDLQAVAAEQAKNFPVALQFTNYRD